ncbi:2-methylaconitate cis-trans isomerase PrpF family protein [Marasmitruncus massiliensis]|uniref:2-methylaconitate cis-trans isomerase PrpF family protein n=1 Tax=Marasmitruncus massiliensis TaxID=1944642 RepID=UPI001FA92A2F|nr:PrpF domain-containing protein [Marasmitruncus massiliensis]
MYHPAMERIPCVIMRGGTSKGIFLKGNDLPCDPAKRDAVILSIFGSPDTRQIDGLGGADPLTSKLAIINRSNRPDADVEYTFGQVDIHSAFVDYSSNCGNISSGVGPFAITEGLVQAQQPVTTVRIYNTNTDKVFIAEVPVDDKGPQEVGEYKIHGVPGTGARIGLNMAGTIGAKTGRLLPTGNPIDTIQIDGFGPLTVSMLDAGSPMVFVRAQDLGLVGTESPNEIDSDPKMLELLEHIRCIAAEKMGIADRATAHEKVRAVPMVAFVSKPQAYRGYTDGKRIEPSEIDFVSRDMFMGIMHKTYSGTATVCTGCAAMTPGTVVQQLMGDKGDDYTVRIGHPSGIIECNVTRENGRIVRAVFGRTARRIMEGYVYVPRTVLD